MRAKGWILNKGVLRRQEWGPRLLDKFHEGGHKLFQAGPESLVQVKGDAQTQHAILLVVRVQHVKCSLHQHHCMRPQQVVVWQPAHPTSSITS